MSDFDCDFGDCDCACDFDCCCCCCPDFDGCFDDCCSLDGNNLCCCILCIGSSNDGNRHNRDSNLLPWLCCCDYGRRRTTYSEEPNWMKDPRDKSSKKEEKEKEKKEPGSKQEIYGTRYSCHGPIDVSPRYKHPYDSFNCNKEKCSRSSSIPLPPPYEPPSIQQFGRLDQEKYVRRHEMYS